MTSCPDCTLYASIEHAERSWDEVKGVWKESFALAVNLIDLEPSWRRSRARRTLMDTGGRCLHHLWKRKRLLELAWRSGYDDGWSCWDPDEAWIFCTMRTRLVYGYPPTPSDKVRQLRNRELVIFNG